MLFRVAIAGPVDARAYARARDHCDYLLGARRATDIVIVAPHNEGRESFGERYAADRGYALDRVPLESAQHGSTAEPQRMRRLCESADAVIVVGAAWPGRHALTFWARERGLAIREVDV